ncbi:MAG: hypothetical protein O7G85_02825 [Planctomycetota bacterium]|nr:hypothetical protein [Planctomycetota bacterium]
MRDTFISICLGLLCSAGHAFGDVVHMRDGQPARTVPIVFMDDGGVTVRIANGDSQVIPWDIVRDVEMETGDHLLAQRLELAQDLWRARSRLQRQDPTLAEPLFERLFERYRGQDNECALIVAEGLLRCRLARGAQESAVIPFLEMVRLRRTGFKTDRYAQLIEVYEEVFGLCPQLAPAWANFVALDKMQRDLSTYDSRGDEILKAIAETYRFSARLALRGATALENDEWPHWPNHDGLDLLEDLLGTMSPDDDRQTSARTRLLRQIPQIPPWAESWIRYRVGISLLTESGEHQRQKGLVSLAHLPARFGRITPYLAGLATARMAQELEREGRSEEGAILRAELERRFPGHPILYMNEEDQKPSDSSKENV